MRLLITRDLPTAVMHAAAKNFNVTARKLYRPMSSCEAREALVRYDAILPTLGDDFSSSSFERLTKPKCKLIANFGVGHNHIDVGAARKLSISVTNTPGAVTDATADIALALMLMTCRRAGEGERMVRSGAWNGWHPTQLLGMHMSGKTLGIIGMGRIGQAIAQRARLGFGMKIIFYNRSKKKIEGCEQLASINQVMALSDVIALALPGGPQTNHIIDRDALASLRPHAVLVNIARGDILDEAALIEALVSGKIAGAGLDVYEYEPKVPDVLKQLENVTLFPHLGTSALSVREDMGFMALSNLTAYLEGRELPNQV